MDIHALLASLEGSGLATRIRDSLFIFPLLESIHVIGLTLVFGTILILDLRLLGLASTGRSVQRIASEILPWTWAAFALTAVTGALMFITNAAVYYDNAFFRAKAALLVLAGLNMVAFEVTARRTIHDWDRAPSAPPAGRFVAVLSLVIWLAVIVTGRMIGFTTSRATTVAPPPADINFEDVFGSPK
ncbi:MAG TPA: DUF6644 family protein [Vicinamibacterales bacterium]|nr:DUF6644 family protein [Vicinamibacterales bacterium]